MIIQILINLLIALLLIKQAQELLHIARILNIKNIIMPKAWGILVSALCLGICLSNMLWGFIHTDFIEALDLSLKMMEKDVLEIIEKLEEMK